MFEHFTEEEKYFIKKVNDYKEQVLLNKKFYLTKFLNLREQELVKIILGNCKSIYYSFYSPFLDANYKRCFMSSVAKEIIEYKVTVFKINYNKKYLTLTNKNVLGNLMSLQIEREVLGEIIITNHKDCYFCVITEMKEYFIRYFSFINHVSITLEEIYDLSEIKNEVEFKEKKLFVKSLRLDLILSHLYNISREASKAIIMQKYVKINYKIIENTSQVTTTCDIITTRTKGKFKIESINGPNKNNNYVLKILIYQ